SLSVALWYLLASPTRRSSDLVAADEAALSLSISRRQVYVLLERYRQGTGLVTDLASRRSDGGKGGSRLSGPVEQVIRELVRKRRSEEHTSELQSRFDLVCRLL